MAQASPRVPSSTIAADRKRFTVEQVACMVAAGVVGEDEPLELIDGELLIMVPQGPEHRAIKDELHERLAEAYRARGAHVLDQGPIQIDASSQPEPDIAVVRGELRDYLHRHPRGDELLLVVEVAQTSQARDHAKAAAYARGAVPVYWLLDLAARRIEVFTQPDLAAERYRVVTILAETETVTPPGLDSAWSLRSMLP